jgi:hypothetical protein
MLCHELEAARSLIREQLMTRARQTTRRFAELADHPNFVCYIAAVLYLVIEMSVSL